MSKRISRAAPVLALVLVAVASLSAGCMPRAGMSNPGWTVVTVQDGSVFAALATGTVLSLDAATGAVQWSYPAAGSSGGGPSCALPFGPRTSQDESAKPLDAVYGIPTVTSELVLVASYDSVLHAYDRDSGAKMPDIYAAGDAIIGSVAVDKGIAFFGSSDYAVYAVDIATRELVWPEPLRTENWVWGAPAVDEGAVYVGSMDRHVYAVDRETGALLWKTSVNGSVPGHVTLADGMVFAGSVDRRLYALDKDSGTVVWRTEPLGGWVWGEALVHDGVVFFGSLDGHLYARSVADGAPVWGPVRLEGALRAGPTLFGEDLVVGTDEGKLYTVGLTDGLMTTQPSVQGSILSSPAVSDDMVFVGTTLGKVHAMDFTRGIGRQLWVYPPEKD